MNTKTLRNYIIRANEKGLFHWLPDKPCLCLLYWARMGSRLNLKNPRTFNEKLQWLKLHNRKPEYTTMVDKILVKDYVASKIGQEYVAPILELARELQDLTGLESSLLVPLWKVLGITLICRLGTQICADAEQKAMSELIRRGGDVLSLYAALPLLRAVLTLLRGLMGG